MMIAVSFIGRFIFKKIKNVDSFFWLLQVAFQAEGPQ